MKKIIFLISGFFFSKRDYERFGIEFFKKKHSVAILDFTAWIYPDYWKKYSSNVCKCEELITISSKNDFLSIVQESDNIIVMDFLGNNKKTNWIRDQIRKKENLLVRFEQNMHPQEDVYISKFLRKLKYLIFSPKSFFIWFVRFIRDKYYNLKRSHCTDILIVGGLTYKKRIKAKKILYAHSWDYDAYLKLREKSESSKKAYAVFIDSDAPSHPDYFLFNLKPPINETQYYPTLTNFFKKFEIKTGLKIKVAAHPKSYNKNLPKLLKGVECLTDQTAELIKNSSMVLMHTSSAVSFAIFFKKPIIFLTSRALEKSYWGPIISNSAKLINNKVINMNDDLDKQLDFNSLMNFDEAKYKNYLDQYLKYPNSPDILSWKIFTDYLEDKKFEKIN